jgi:hypothetical protein
VVDDKSLGDSHAPRGGRRPGRAADQPDVTPEADEREGRVTYEGGTDRRTAEAVPDRPLPPQD